MGYRSPTHVLRVALSAAQRGAGRPRQRRAGADFRPSHDRRHPEGRLSAGDRSAEYVRGHHNRQVRSNVQPSHNCAAALKRPVRRSIRRGVAIDDRHRPSGFARNRCEASELARQPEAHPSFVRRSRLCHEQHDRRCCHMQYASRSHIAPPLNRLLAGLLLTSPARSRLAATSCRTMARARHTAGRSRTNPCPARLLSNWLPSPQAPWGRSRARSSRRRW